MKTPQIIVAGISPEGAKAADELTKKIEEKFGPVTTKKTTKKGEPETADTSQAPPEEKPEAQRQPGEQPTAAKEEPKPRKKPELEKILADVERLNELTKQRNILISYKATLEALDFQNASNASLILQGNGFNKKLETSNTLMLEDVREFLLTRLEKRLMGVQDEIALTYAQINDPEALPF